MSNEGIILKTLESIERRMATKDDIVAIRSDMVTKNDLSREIGSVRSEMTTKEDVASIRADMATKADIKSIRSEMATKKDLERFATKSNLEDGLASVRSEMATKKDLEREIGGVRAHMASMEERLVIRMDDSFESFAQMVQHGFEQVAVDIESLEGRLSKRVGSLEEKVTRIDEKVECIDDAVTTLLGLDHQHQIDVLRDDMCAVKTKLKVV